MSRVVEYWYRPLVIGAVSVSVRMSETLQGAMFRGEI